MIEIEGLVNHSYLADFVKIISSKSENQKIEYKEFYELTSHHIFIRKVFDWELIIPHF